MTNDLHIGKHFDRALAEHQGGTPTRDQTTERYEKLRRRRSWSSFVRAPRSHSFVL